LHLKDFVIYLEKGNMLVSPHMNEEPAFAEYDRFVVEPEELYAINSMNINGTVLVPEGFPETLRTIKELGYPTIVINNSEFAKIDGSLTCLSLRF
ncbi:MAG: N(G),N(G)-dimethylarginine dimethylaminohydrolase, partial [Firmicutes bacterium]|nr:N(G),N(G)-dimethylarginine dimethylaminohydrolase [Bacillota bacterium]